MFILIPISLISIGYIYRIQLLPYIYKSLIYCIKGYLYITNNNSDIKHINTIDLYGDNLKIFHYKCKIKKDLKIISDKIQKVDISDNLFNKRYIFVHSHIANKNEIIELDLTKIFREFVYHFDKDDDNSKLKHFFNYLELHYNLKNINDMYLIIYMNDDSFTEYKYNINNIYDSKYKDILIIEPKTNIEQNSDIFSIN